MDTKSRKLMRDDIEALTSFQAGKMRGVEFAGFMVREDEDAVYVADPQGTWMIPRDNILKFGPWEGAHCVPDDMRAVGKPVRVTMKEDSTFYEIRPWRVSPDPISPDPAPPITSGDVRQIFSLANGTHPLTESGLQGERQLKVLERQLSRQLGFHPDICSDPVAFHDGGVVACGSSATSDQNSDGAATRSDTDSDF